MLILIFLPLLTACLGYPVCRRFGERADDRCYSVLLCSTVLEFGAALFAALKGSAALQIPLVCGLGISLRMDGFRAVYVMVLSFMWMMAAALSRQYFAGHHRLSRLYFFLMMTESAIMGVFLADDLFTALIFFEVMSFTSFPWVIQEETKEAIRAANTYLAIAVIGGLAALYGIFLLMAKLGTVSLTELPAAAAACPDKAAIYAAGGCILAGFGAKAGMFPLHIWLPKAHPVAPAPASALLSGALTKAGIWGVIALSCGIFRGDPAWGTVILVLGTVTMLLGAVLALFSVNLKRTLACSSMSQIGFIFIGIAMTDLLGAENALAARGALLHMVNHSLFKLVLFLCAGAVFMNTEKLELNDIRGFGRSKPLLHVCFLLGAAGIAGIPGLNGYVSKTLLHEAIVEGLPLYGAGLKLVEWIFLISGGLTLAYMTKLYVCLFVQKPAGTEKSSGRSAIPAKTRQSADTAAKTGGAASSKPYLTGLSAAALAGSAVLLPLLGLTASITMDRIADLGTDFFRAGAPEHAVHYFAWTNLKGGLISIAIGAAVYLLLVRPWMMKDGTYLDRWPKWLELEEQLYRPLLQKWLPSLFGSISAVFAENKLSAPLARGIFRGALILTHALSDLVDALVLLIRRTLLKERRPGTAAAAESALTYHLGEQMDHLMALRHREAPGERRYARLSYRLGRTLRQATHDLFDSVSFALFMLVLAICAILIYILVIYI